MPVKQNLAVGLSLLFNFVFAVLFIVGFILLSQAVAISFQIYILGFVIFCAVIGLVFNRWFENTGCKRFIALS